MSKIGVGVIGASPSNPGWAVLSHLPAIAALPDYELRAVATSSAASAKAASEAYGVPGHADSAELITRDDVDLVVVTVKLPYHYDLVAQAFAAGKQVMCEWPLATTLEQTSALGEQAASTGLASLIGLQARMTPSIRYARELIARGDIGEVLSTSVTGVCPPWSGVGASKMGYIFDVKNNATLLSVPGMHALDALQFVLGDLADVRAVDAVRRPQVHLADTGETITSTTPDHLAVAATLESGAVASIFFRGGQARGDNFRWEIHGSKGDLLLTSPQGFIQAVPPTLLGAFGKETEFKPLEIPAKYDLFPGAPAGPAGNVARLYNAFARDLHDGVPARTAPNFAHAVRLHELQERIAKAAEVR